MTKRARKFYTLMIQSLNQLALDGQITAHTLAVASTTVRYVTFVKPGK